MVAATDAVWISVLPSMKGFGPALAKGADAEAGKAGKLAGMSFGKAALAATALVAGGAVLATKALYNIGETFQGVENTIRVGTGATGKALEGLADSAKNVGTRIPANFDDVGTAIADVNTRLGLTGKPLEDISAQFLELSRITGTDVASNIENVSRVFGDWGVAADDQAGSLDYLFKVSQTTGIGIDELSNKVVQYGAPMRQFGFSFEESAALMGKWGKEGVNTETIMGGLRAGLGKLAKSGKDPAVAFQEITDKIKNAGTEGEATAIAIETFGQRAGPDLAAAVREGRFELDDLMDTLDASGETIMSAGADTMDFSEQWLMFKNQVMVDLAPIAKRVFDTITAGMTWLRDSGIPAIREFGKWVQKNSSWLAPLATGIGTVVGLVAGWAVVIKALNVVLAIKAALLGTIGAPIILIVVLIAGLVAALVTAYKTSDTFRAVVDRAWAGVKKAIESVVGWFTGTAGPAIKGVWDGIAAGAMWLWNNVLKPAWEGIRLAVAVAIEAIRLLWNNVLKPVWDAVAKAANWMWNNVLKNVFTFISSSWTILVGAIKLGWERILKPAWDAVQNAAKWMHDRVLKPTFDLIGRAWKALLDGINKVWTSVLRPAWKAVEDALNRLWNSVIKPVLGFIGDVWDRVLRGMKRIWENVLKPVWNAVAAAAKWLWEMALQPVFRWVGERWSDLLSGMKRAYENVLRPVFKFFGDAVGSLKGVFERAVGAIGRAWDRLKGIAKAPVRFVVNTVINDALIDNFNKIARFFGADRIARLKLPGGFAEGGYTGAGGKYEPAGVVHRGEFVVRSESQSAMTRQFPGLLEHINTTGTLPGYAGGGFVGRAWSAVKGAASSALDFLTDPARMLRKAVERIVGRIGSSPLASMLAKVPTKLIGSVVSKIRGLIPSVGDVAAVTSPGRGGLGPAALRAMQTVRSVFGFTGTIGGYANRNIAGTNKLSKHALGKAIDVMTYSNMALGNRIAEFFRSNRGVFGVDNVIFNRRIANARHGWQWGRYTGQNPHTDHPHIDFFDQGGWLQPGVSQVANWTGKPEPVLTDGQWQTMQAAVAGSDGPTVQYVYDTDGVLMGSMQIAARREVAAHAGRQARDVAVFGRS